MMRMNASLAFDGRCKEAFLAYHRILGGAIQTMMTYGESPMASQFEPKWHSRILHATLSLGDAELMGADVLSHDYRKPQGFSVMLTVDGVERGRQIFESLAEGGEIRLPFAPTFWSPGFGVLVDRFDVPWEINTVGPAMAP
jgi:PhnB protein